jgi:hypothetical protein
MTDSDAQALHVVSDELDAVFVADDGNAWTEAVMANANRGRPITALVAALSLPDQEKRGTDDDSQ